MIKRQKQSIFLDVKETCQVLEVKKMVGGIMKKSPEDIKLLFKSLPLDDSKSLKDVGLTSQTTKAQSPALIGLCLKEGDNDFEELTITPVSKPPELPPQMKTQESPTAGS